MILCFYKFYIMHPLELIHDTQKKVFKKQNLTCLPTVIYDTIVEFKIQNLLRKILNKIVGLLKQYSLKLILNSFCAYTSFFVY